MPTLPELRHELSTLSTAARAELALYLIESLDAERDDDAESLWREELQRRADEILGGTACGEEAQVVMERLRTKHS